MFARRLYRRLALAGLAFLLVVAGPARPAPAQEAGTIWPTEGWLVSTPEEQGMDSRLLADMLAFVDEEDILLDSVLIVRNGYLVAEVYYPPYKADTVHRLYSVTKSVTSALVGIAIDRGYIAGVQERVLSFFPDRIIDQLSADKQAMTLEDFLTMRAGLHWPDDNLALTLEMASKPDWVQFVLNRRMDAPPGTEFVYNNGVSHTLLAIVQQATGMDAADLADEALFAPLGIEYYMWETDRQGIVNGAWGLLMLPRDMAKFGYLYLHNGQWEDRQIVSAEWVAASTQAHVTFPDGAGYGYQWWIYPDEGLYAARGLQGQIIFVVPDRAMVVVFTARLSNDASDILHALLTDYILPAVRSEEPLPPNPEGEAALERQIDAISG